MLLNSLRIKPIISLYKWGNVKILLVLLFLAYHDRVIPKVNFCLSQKINNHEWTRKERPERMSLTDTWPQTLSQGPWITSGNLEKRNNHWNRKRANMRAKIISDTQFLVSWTKNEVSVQQVTGLIYCWIIWIAWEVVSLLPSASLIPWILASLATKCAPWIPPLTLESSNLPHLTFISSNLKVALE